MLSRIKNYRKLIAASAAVAAVWAQAAQDGVITGTDYETLATAGMGLFFVWLVKNDAA